MQTDTLDPEEPKDCGELLENIRRVKALSWCISGVCILIAILYCLEVSVWGWLLAASTCMLVGVYLMLMSKADAQVAEGRALMLEKLTESLPGMIYQCRLYPTGKCVVTYSNDAIEWIYEKSLAEMQRDCSSIWDLVHEDDRKRIMRGLKTSARKLTPWKGEYRVVLPRQGLRWRSAQARVERLADGSTLWYGFIADITAMKEVEEATRLAEQEKARKEAVKVEREKVRLLSMRNEELLREVNHDGLTGVYIRRYFDRRFPEVFALMRKKKRPITLLFCDIDYFKQYNDQFGHQAGDECLVVVAKTIASEINRGEQFVARYGGEEFVAVLPGLGTNRARTVAEKVRKAVEALPLKRGVSADAERVTLSIGLASMDEIPHSMDPETCLKEADEAIYEAKKAGRNRVCERIFDRKSDSFTMPDRKAFDSSRISF